MLNIFPLEVVVGLGQQQDIRSFFICPVGEQLLKDSIDPFNALAWSLHTWLRFQCKEKTILTYLSTSSYPVFEKDPECVQCLFSSLVSLYGNLTKMENRRRWQCSFTFHHIFFQRAIGDISVEALARNQTVFILQGLVCNTILLL